MNTKLISIVGDYSASILMDLLAKHRIEYTVEKGDYSIYNFYTDYSDRVKLLSMIQEKFSEVLESLASQ